MLAFLGLTASSLLIVTALSYITSRNALHEEIRSSLQRDARVVVEDIDTQLFERVKDLVGWANQEVMQDASVGDVDKRLATLLEKIQASYQGIYTQLYFVSMDGQVVAASSRDRIGEPWLPDRHTPWQTVEHAGGRVVIDRLRYSERFNTVELPMHIAIPSRFSGESLGELFAVLDWAEIERLLDHAVDERGGERLALLLDREGRFLGGSNNSKKLGFPPGALLRLQESDVQSGLVEIYDRRGSPISFLASYARSQGIDEFPGLGFRVIVAEPADRAFSPVTHLLHLLGIIFFVTLVAAVAISSLLSRRISEPITRLADFARHFDAERSGAPPAAAGVQEVTDLSHAFEEMTHRLKQSRDQLVRASKLAAVGEMAATMAHEVRTPLGILQSSAQLLADDQALSDEGREMVEFILAETQRLDGLVTMLIECGRPRPPAFRSVDLNELTERVLGLLSQKIDEKNLSVHFDAESSGTMIEADSDQMQQVLINLLLNAIQILPPGGEIWIETRRYHQSLVLAIADNGPGIPAERRSRIFEPFVSWRDGGFGLGLSVVQQILQQHDAVIEVEERDGGGALFRIFFKYSGHMLSQR